jgi:hypothetical protein
MITAYFALRQFVLSRTTSELTNRVFVASGWGFGEAQSADLSQFTPCCSRDDPWLHNTFSCSRNRPQDYLRTRESDILGTRMAKRRVISGSIVWLLAPSELCKNAARHGAIPVQAPFALPVYICTP